MMNVNYVQLVSIMIYWEFPNENNCKTCISGKIGIIEGAKSNQSCIKCDVGLFKSTLNSCSQCPNGSDFQSIKKIDANNARLVNGSINIHV